MTMYDTSGAFQIRQDAIDGPCANFGVAQHAPFGHLPGPGFELRFDEKNGMSLWCDTNHGRQHLGQRDETQIRHENIDRLGQVFQMTCIGSFHYDHTVVRTEFPCQLPVADVDGIHAPCACLQEAVGKPPGRRAEVDAGPVRGIQREGIQGGFELQDPWFGPWKSLIRTREI